MAQTKPTRVYTKGTVSVEWRPELCIHCQICITTSPKIFQLDRRPWVDLEQGTEEEIRNTVSHCPSGALSIAQ